MEINILLVVYRIRCNRMKFFHDSFGFKQHTPFDTGFEKLSKELPLHHVDSSIFMQEPTSDSGRNCARYLDKCGDKFRAKVSSIALAEITLKAFGLQHDKMYDYLQFIKTAFITAKIGYYNMINLEKITTKLEKLDLIDKFSRGTDRLIIGSAFADEDRVSHLVTVDRSMLSNKKIAAFGLGITHPEKLL